MELVLLKLVAFARPLVSMRFGEAFFSLFGIGLFAILVGAVLVRTAVRRSLNLSAIDGLILAFIIWCVARAAIYADATYIGQLTKLLLPMLGFIIVKNVIPNRAEYTRMLFWILVGFSVPVLLSAGLIAIGNPDSIAMVKYQTGIARWQGAYSNSHSFGHSMTLFLMTMVLYVILRENGEGSRYRRMRQRENIFFGFLVVVALYCLYMGQVRTALLGLLIFLGLYGYFQNKRLLLMGGAALTVVAVATAPIWIPVLLHEFAPDRRGGEPGVMELGSGRLSFWVNDLTLFTRLSIDRMISGLGIGKEFSDVGEQEGHSDWIRMLLDTGIVGFMLFAGIQLAILRAILRMAGKERYAFFALFAAVNVMMFVSNSYALRIQVSQLYYMILAFIQIPHGRARTERVAVKTADQAA